MKFSSTLLVFYFFHLSSIAVSGQNVNKTCDPFKLTFYTHKTAEVFIGGKEVPYKVFGGISSIEVTENTCEDILFVLENQNLGTPVAVAAIMESGDDLYATSFYIKGGIKDQTGATQVKYATIPFAEQGGVKPLFAITTNEEFNPTKTVDYSGWRGPMIVDAVLKENFGYYSDFRDEGALPLSWSDGPMKLGTFGLKICNPLGAPSKDAHTVLSSCFM